MDVRNNVKTKMIILYSTLAARHQLAKSNSAFSESVCKHWYAANRFCAKTFSASWKWTCLRGRSSCHSPNVDEWRLPAAAAVAQKQLGALQAAMVEVGRLPAVGAVDAGEALRHRLPSWAVDDGQVSDWRLGPAGLRLWQVLLQGRRLVR